MSDTGKLCKYLLCRSQECPRSSTVITDNKAKYTVQDPGVEEDIKGVKLVQSNKLMSETAVTSSHEIATTESLQCT